MKVSFTIYLITQRLWLVMCVTVTLHYDTVTLYMFLIEFYYCKVNGTRANYYSCKLVPHTRLIKHQLSNRIQHNKITPSSSSAEPDRLEITKFGCGGFFHFSNSAFFWARSRCLRSSSSIFCLRLESCTHTQLRRLLSSTLQHNYGLHSNIALR